MIWFYPSGALLPTEPTRGTANSPATRGRQRDDSRPGIVLKRPVGLTGKFKENAELPTALVTGGGRRPKSKKRRPAKANRQLATNAPRERPPRRIKSNKQNERQRLGGEAARRHRDKGIEAAPHRKSRARAPEKEARNWAQRRQARGALTRLTRWEKLRQKLETTCAERGDNRAALAPQSVCLMLSPLDSSSGSCSLTFWISV